MGQLPVGNSTYSRLQILKSRAVVARGGKAVTWDGLLDLLCDVSNKNIALFDGCASDMKGSGRKTYTPDDSHGSPDKPETVEVP